MNRPFAWIALGLLVSGCGESGPADGPVVAANQAVAVESLVDKPTDPLPDVVRVRLETDVGAIVLTLDAKRAPITAANFVRYAEEQRFDGTSFYRAAVTKGISDRGFIQGGIRRNYRRMLAPIEHEPTSKTGLNHEAGTISMARSESGAGAMGDFFITVSAQPAMDAKAGEQGYAAFGRVAEGMDVVRRIHSAERVANAGRGAMKGQMLAKPVQIVSAKRVD